MRGVAREAATAYGAAAAATRRLRRRLPAPNGATATRSRSPTRPAATASSPRDGHAASTRGRHAPLWLRRRLQPAGMRPISLAVDVTNYVMLELGQPLHAFDRGKLTGPIVVRRAEPGETLDDPRPRQRATLRPEDLVITDDSRRRSALAGVMGGAAHRDRRRERHRRSCIEAAHFAPAAIARTAAPAQAASARRPSASSAASTRGCSRRRAAARRPAALLARAGRRRRRRRDRGRSHRRAPAQRSRSTPTTPDRVAGHRLRPRDASSRACSEVGCDVARRATMLIVTLPSLAARPDRPVRPRRGGHPARGLRELPLDPAARARRAAG